MSSDRDHCLLTTSPVTVTDYSMRCRNDMIPPEGKFPRMSLMVPVAHGDLYRSNIIVRPS